MIGNRFILSATFGLAAMLCGTAAQSIVITSLPRSPFTSPQDEWTESTFGDTTLTTGPTSVTLTTVNGQGEWFGWGTGYSDPQPDWELGDTISGNDFRFTARLGDGSRDWSSYLADGTSYADIELRPTVCDLNVISDCYSSPYFEGVSLLFSDPLNGGAALRTFVALDMSIDHSFGYLMKGGLVSYLVDGMNYAGYAQNSGGRILVTGDSSGSTPTGTGSMTISGISIDTAPTANIEIGTVPEPATWLSMIGGFGLVGAAARRTKRRLAHR